MPSGDRLRPLDGLRALSVLWVVVFHTAWYAAPHISPRKYAAMLGARWMIPVWRGEFGVDIFFVLSGFLIAGLLIDQRAKIGRTEVVRFWVRRLFRLWPVLLVAAFFEVLLIGDNKSKIWANLLYVSNFVPILQAAMGWTWSLAIEEQFYVLCPWLIIGLARFGPRARLGIIAVIIAVLMGVAVYVIGAKPFFAIDLDVVINRHFLRWAEGFDALYAKPWMRAAPLLVGMAAAYAYRMPHVMERLGRSRFLGAALLVLALGVAAASTHWQLVIGMPRSVEIAYMATFRTAFGLSIGYLLLFSVSRNPVGKIVGRVLSWRVLYPIGQLAYGAYLVNPIACTLIHRALKTHLWKSKTSPMQILLPLDIAATFIAAALLYLLVERPFMELRPSSTSKRA